METLDDAEKQHIAKNGYKDFKSLVRSDISTRQLVGADKATVLRLPGQPRGENPGAWRDIDKALGVPEDGKYPDFAPASGKLSASPEQLSAFDKSMHAAGVPPYARNAALSAFHDINQGVVTALNREKAEAIAKLQGEWGVKFAAKTQAADAALDGVAGADEFDALLDRYGISDHPAVTKVLASIAEARAEDGAPINKGDGRDVKIVNGKAQMTPAEAQVKLSSLEADEGYMKRYLAGGVTEMNEILALYAAVAEGQR